jgi:hypothetical protein
MGALTPEKLMDMDTTSDQFSSPAQPVCECRESNSPFWRKTLFDKLIPAALVEGPNNRTGREEFRPDDYHIALIPRQSGSHSQTGLPLSRSNKNIWILPVTWHELLDRLRTELNHSVSAGRGEIFRFGEVAVDFRRVEVSRSGKIIVLKPLEIKLLQFFTQNPERVIARDELLDKVWGYRHYPSTRTIDNHVYVLRRKLEINPLRPRHFITAHGMGYKFVP